MSTTSSPTTQRTTSSRTVRAGQVITVLLMAFLVFDSVGKLARFDTSVDATRELGFADHHVVLIGALLAIGIVLHSIPRTALVGAVYLSAYLGGAVAAHVRVDQTGPAVFAVVFGVAIWVGYVLREPRVRALL